jgi:signal transduction histidine kinase
MKKQVVSITEQLIDINKNKRDKKLTIALINKEIEELTENINATLNLKKQSEINNLKLQGDLRQAIVSISHDLRTPLTSIIGYIQFCKLDNIKEEERKEYLKIAEQRAKLLEILLNDFYELSLIEYGDNDLKLESLNLSSILKELLLGRYTDFLDKGLEPTIEIPDNNIYIMAEQKALERIIENLLGNTIKYAKDNLNISLTLEKETALLKISNTTEDLNSIEVDKIFDKLYMADQNRSGKGTGLGLAIVKSLIEKMCGSIDADKSGNMLNIYCRFKYHRH